MITPTTFGQVRMAVARNSSSGPLYSWEASDTKRTASAIGSAPRVITAWAPANPPTPGVSTSTRPPWSRGAGRPISTDRTCLMFSGLAASVAKSSSWSTGISVRSWAMSISLEPELE